MPTGPQDLVTRTRRLARLVTLLELTFDEAEAFREESIPVVGVMDMRTIESVVGAIATTLERVRRIEHNESIRGRG